MFFRGATLGAPFSFYHGVPIMKNVSEKFSEKNLPYVFLTFFATCKESILPERYFSLFPIRGGGCHQGVPNKKNVREKFWEKILPYVFR